MKDFCKKLLLYTDEANDKHKRLFDIYGGFSPAEPEEFMPVLYALMCNVHVLRLVEITKFLKTSGSNHSMWVSKTKPKGFLAKLEKAEQRIIGFLYKRSRSFNVLFAEYTKHADPTSQPDCYKFRILQQTVPDGWDKTSRESLPGNTVDNGQFSLMAELLIELAKIWNKIKNKEPQPAADQKLVEALTNFITLRTFANSIRSEYEESGIQMKKAPEYIRAC